MKLRHFVQCLAVVVILFGFGRMPVVANESAVKDDVQPIHIEADRMESLERKEEVFFFGKVKAIQADMVLTADEMTVCYVSADGDIPEKGVMRGRRVDRLSAKGNVKLTNAVGWIATGKAMEYFSVDRRVVVIGDAKVWQDNNMVSGNKVILYLDEGKSVVESGSQQGKGRVKALLYPEREKENKAGK